MSSVENLQLTFAFALAVVFTALVFMVDEENKVTVEYFAGVLWLINGILQWLGAATPGVLTIGLCWLFIGIGSVFLASGMFGSFQLVKEHRKGRPI